VSLALLMQLAIGSHHLVGDPGAAIVVTGFTAGLDNIVEGMINGDLIFIAPQSFTQAFGTMHI
jgi:hypothetical protein